jgi:anti-sigma factor RsiW
MLSARPGELGAADEEALRRHLAGCDACQARLADGAAAAGLVAEGLLAAAARVDLAPLADEVMARVGRRGLAGALRWLARHRAVAAATALAPAALALGLVLYFGGEADVAPLAGEVEVVAEGFAPVVLTGEEGPVVLLGETAEGS